MRVALNQGAGLTFPGMSQAVRAGNLVILSGQVALDESGAVVGLGDAEVQAERCFLNIEQLLQLAGASIHDVVKLTCYLADRSAYAAYAAAKLRRFPAVGPAGTAVVVSALLDDRLLMEVEAIAVIGSD